MARREPWHTFGKKLRTLRTERALSQASLANLAGVDQTHISLLERGERQPTLPTMYRLSEALDMTLAEFVAEIDGADDQ